MRVSGCVTLPVIRAVKPAALITIESMAKRHTHTFIELELGGRSTASLMSIVEKPINVLDFASSLLIEASCAST